MQGLLFYVEVKVTTIVSLKQENIVKFYDFSNWDYPCFLAKRTKKIFTFFAEI
jgi:hypothetical protein